jgi:Fuc2NAc and GlcNAc transferase
VLTYIFFLFARHQKNLIALPNHRSSHTTPTPRGGAVIFIGIWCISLLIQWLYTQQLPTHLFLKLFPFTIAVAVLGFLSDFYALRARARLGAQLLITFLFLFLFDWEFSDYIFQDYALYTSYTSLSFIITLVAIIWSVNLFNFMDGTDGIASVEATFILTNTGFLFYLSNQTELAFLIFLLVCGLLGFLLWNWPAPAARIFMGDSGSYTLGFLIALFSFMGIQAGLPIVLFLMVYSVFLFDATLTLVRRLVNREPIFSAHKKHAYQRLHQGGWSHQKILLFFIILNTGITTVTLYTYNNPACTPWSFSFLLCCLSLIYYKIEQFYPFKKSKT